MKGSVDAPSEGSVDQDRKDAGVHSKNRKRWQEPLIALTTMNTDTDWLLSHFSLSSVIDDLILAARAGDNEQIPINPETLSLSALQIPNARLQDLTLNH